MGTVSNVPMLHTTPFPCIPAGNAKPNRPAIGNLIEMAGRTGGVGDRTLTAHLIETPPFAVPFVAECGGKTAGVKVRAPRAIFVDHPLVGKLRAAELVQRGSLPWLRIPKPLPAGCKGWEGNRKVHNRFARDHRIHAHGAGWIRVRGRHSAPRRAGTDRDYGRRLRGDVPHHLDRRLAASSM